MLNYVHVLVAGNRVLCVSEDSEVKVLFREYCAKYPDKINRKGFLKKGASPSDFASDADNFIEAKLEGVI